jgi:hypothetical protein
VPPNSACEVNATVILVEGENAEAVKMYLCGVLNSFVLDYVLRAKVSTTLNMFYIQSLPMPRLTAGDPTFDAIVARAARLVCTRPEYDALWAAVMGDLTPRPPLPPGEGERLRDEIDGLVARLYGLSRDEFAHILGSFPLVFPQTEAGAAVLAAYDRAGA